MLVTVLREGINRRAWPHVDICYIKLVDFFFFFCVETFIPLSQLQESWTQIQNLLGEVRKTDTNMHTA